MLPALGGCALSRAARAVFPIPPHQPVALPRSRAGVMLLHSCFSARCGYIPSFPPDVPLQGVLPMETGSFCSMFWWSLLLSLFCGCRRAFPGTSW